MFEALCGVLGQVDKYARGAPTEAERRRERSSYTCNFGLCVPDWKFARRFTELCLVPTPRVYYTQSYQSKIGHRSGALS